MTEGIKCGRPLSDVNIVAPLEQNGGIPVNVQDQTTPPFDFYFTRGLTAPTTLSANTSINSHTLVVADATGFAIGSYIGLFSGASLENRYYFGTVLNVVGSTLTVDSPLDFAFQSGDPILTVSRDLNVDGSGTPLIYSIQGGGTGSTLEVDITRIMIIMTCSSAIDLDLFGNLAALTRGLVMRRRDGETRNIWNIKQNKDFALIAYDYTPFTSANPAQGVDGLKCRYTFAGQDKHGVAVRLGANESLDIIVQDDLRLISSLQIMGQGHEVTD
jgi:hypothetical protein